jgi:HD-GYP domain-containing protein (c-di-GMP phosphodiesterase class II)
MMTNLLPGLQAIRPVAGTGRISSLEGALQTLDVALRRYDDCTYAHSRRVVGYAQTLGAELGLDQDNLRLLGCGVFLHDIGKLSVPEEILQKPSALTWSEWVTMKQHPIIGYRLVCDLPILGEAARVVLFHHEWHDGRGYPYGLKGDDIPLGARICAVVDTLDALTSYRPYRNPVSFEIACSYIATQQGTHFDPRVVDAFLAIPTWQWALLQTGPTRTSDLPN